MHRYSPDQIELLMAIAGVMLFAGISFPLVRGLTRGAGPWVQIPLASVPLVLLAAVLVVFWRRFRE